MASIHLNRHGYLYISFRFEGRQYTEPTKLSAVKKNGAILPEDPKAFIRLKRAADLMAKEIKAGGFDYFYHFPDSDKAKNFIRRH